MPSSSKEPFKVAIIGAPTSSGNRGVLALASALVNLFAQARPEIRATLLVGSPSPIPLKTIIDGAPTEIQAINYRHTYKSGLATCLPWIFLASLAYRALPIQAWRRYLRRKIPWIDCLAAADVVGDVRGGDSFSDIYGMKRYFWGFICACTALLVHGSLVQFPQTYGPYKRPIARSMARFLLRRSSTIVARDTKSQAVADALLKGSKPVQLSPDVAFALEVANPRNVPCPSKPVIGINVNGLMYNGGYDRKNMFGLALDYPAFLQRLISELLSKHPDFDIWLVPHTYAAFGDVESDNEACEKVKDALPPHLQGSVTVIADEYDQHQIKGIIGRCDAFIGSRMHSCIAALSQGIPCIGLAYSMKFSGVFQSVGMEDWVIDAKEKNTENAVARALELLDERDQRRADLQKAVHSARDQLKTIFQRLAGSLQPSPEHSHSR